MTGKRKGIVVVQCDIILLMIVGLYFREKKVVLRGENHLHLQELEALAKTNQLFSHLIHDAGRTQIPPNSVTVLALFGPCNRVDTVTGELSLL